MSLYPAIDLHAINSVLAVLDESDRPLRQRRLPNELPVILKQLEPFHDETTGIVVESTYNGYWLVHAMWGRRNYLFEIRSASDSLDALCLAADSG